MVVDRWMRTGNCLVVLALVTWCGCSGGSDQEPSDGNATTAATESAAAVDPDRSPVRIERHATPDATVTQFLTALRAGDQPRATAMLTVKAQQEMEKSEAAIQPPGSPTAQFAVTQTEIIGDQEDGAHVLSVWTDTEETGATSTYEIVWILRRESSGWAIAGFATRVFEDRPPLILNFENPQELRRQRNSIDDEIARRSDPQTASRSPSGRVQ